MKLPKLLGLSGSLRSGSSNTAILRTLGDAISDKASLQLHSLDDIPLYNADRDGATPPDGVASLKAALAEADGLIIATPEYNHGTSGVLKNAIDWASRPAFASPLKDLPVLIISSSPAATGGVRAQSQVRQMMAASLSRVLPHPELVVPGVFQKIVDGVLVDAPTLSFVLAAIDELLGEIAHLARRRSTG